MATEDVLSGYITNRDAVPITHTTGAQAGGTIKRAGGTVEAAVADVGSTYRMCSIPSNAMFPRVFLSNDAIATAGAVNIGIYQTTANGSAVVDADHFASAVACTSAQKNLEATHESGVYGVEDIEKPLWEALGLSEDPKCDYDVVLTTSTAFQGAGTLSLVVEYTTNQ
ncbi:MAG: hypothetical protein KDI23_04335 [Pseudomonadales bacterium]|nr:hypothetical protein [Pseudomonadales bacterium]